MFKIETWENNPILRKVADPVTKKNWNEAVKLWKKMLSYIKDPDNGWIGLAAPQIWQSIRLVVLGLPKTREDENFRYYMMINPEIVEYGTQTEFDEEHFTICIAHPCLQHVRHAPVCTGRKCHC